MREIDQKKGYKMLTTTVTTRKATAADVDTIRYIASRNKKEIGFVRLVSLMEAILQDSLYVAESVEDQCVIGFANIWRRRTDEWLTLMEICVDADYRRQGAGRALLELIRKDNGNRPVRLKCPVDNASNGFYKRLGFRLARLESATETKRALNVWVIE